MFNSILFAHKFWMKIAGYCAGTDRQIDKMPGGKGEGDWKVRVYLTDTHRAQVRGETYKDRPLDAL